MGIDPDKARKEKKAAKQHSTLAPVVQLPRGDNERRQRFAHGFLNYHANVLANTSEGQRHHTLLARARVLGGILWTGDITPTDVLTALTAASNTNGHTKDTTEQNIKKTIEDGLRDGANQPILDFYDQLTDDETNWMSQWSAHINNTADRGHQAHQMVDTFWNNRPLLRHIYDTAQQGRVGPYAYLGAILANLLAHTPHRVCLPAITGGRASLNLLFALVGPSGGGKGAAIGLAHDTWEYSPLPEIPLSDFANTSQYPVTVNIGSGEGFTHVYATRHRGQDHRTNYNALFKVDEIDTLTALAGRKGSTILSVLRQIYSGERLGFQTADTTRRVQINELDYRAALIAGVQPLRAASLMAGADGGTPQRFLFLPTDDPTAPTTLIPKPMLKIRHEMVDFVKTLGEPLDLQLPQIIVDTVQHARLAMLTNQKEASENAAGHDTLTRIKVAALLAILGDDLKEGFDGRLTTSGSRSTINDDDWHLAGQLLTLSINERTNIQHELAAKASQERQRQAVAKIEDESAGKASIEDKVWARLAVLAEGPTPPHGWTYSKIDNSVTRGQRDVFRRLWSSGEVSVKDGQIHVNRDRDDRDGRDA